MFDYDNKVYNLSIEETKELIRKNKDLYILDVRTKEEYDIGHIGNATLIPYNELESRIDEISQYKDTPLLIYCRTGRRSSIAIDTLIDFGFNKIYHMREGISCWK